MPKQSNRARKKNKPFDKKEGVEFKLMYRDHADPLYYDPKANARILVPVEAVGAMPPEKRALVESVPAEDRGEILTDQEYARKGYGQSAGADDQMYDRALAGGGADLHENLSKLVELDQFTAAAKKQELKLQSAMAKRQAAKKKGGEVVFKEEEDGVSEGSEASGGDHGENPYDSDERDFKKAAKAEEQFKRERDLGHNDNEDDDHDDEASYDSELEAEFFGTKNPELNDRIFDFEKKAETTEATKKEEEDHQQSAKQEAQIGQQAASAKPPGAKAVVHTKKGVQAYDPADFTDAIEDVNLILKKARNLYKPAEGVAFTQYDRLGYKVDAEQAQKKPEEQPAEQSKTQKKAKTKKSQAEQAEEEDARHDWREYLAREGDDEGFEFIAAPEECLQIAREIMAKQSQFKGGRKDVDLLEEEMNPEEKAVFAVLDGSDDEANDEVDDDFLAMLNDGQPGLELVGAKEKAAEKARQNFSAAQENQGVIVIKDEPGQDGLSQHPMMIANYKERMADVIQMLEKQQEFKQEAVQTGERADVVDVRARSLVNQKQYDDVFAAYLAKEYKDEQIGDLEGDRGVDPLAFLEEMEDGEAAAESAKPTGQPSQAAGAAEEQDKDFYDYGELSDGDEEAEAMYEQKQVADGQLINEAVDEFIEDKKLWFRGMHKKYGDDILATAHEKGANFLPGTALYVGDAKMLPISGALQEESSQYKQLLRERTLEQRPEEDSSDLDGSSSEDSAEQWDAETILSTFTNTDNHPNLIKYVPKVKPSQKLKMELHKQFKIQVPVGGLDGLTPIAEVIPMEKSKEKKAKEGNAVGAFQEDDSTDKEDAADIQEEAEPPQSGTTDLNPRKLAKKELKAERRERRKQKKELKIAFSQQKGKLVKQQTATHAGDLRPGVSFRKIA